MKGESTLISEHSKNNQGVREFLIKSAITPENLLPETDIQKLKRQQETEVKKLGDMNKK